MIDMTLVWMGRVAVADGHLDNSEKRIIREYGEISGLDNDEVENFLKSLELEAAAHRRLVQPVRPEEMKGLKFENFIFRMISRLEDMEVVSRSADYKLSTHGGRLDQRSRKPDLFVRVRFGFFKPACWIECKYRSRGDLRIRMGKIKDYVKAGNDEFCPVFILFGAGGMPEKPEDLFLIPIGDIVSGKAARFSQEKFMINASALQDYKIEPVRIAHELKKFLRM